MMKPGLALVALLSLVVPLAGCGSADDAPSEVVVSGITDRETDVEDRAVGYLATGSDDKLEVKCAAVLVGTDKAISLASCVGDDRLWDPARVRELRVGFGDIRGTRASEPLNLRRVTSALRVEAGDSVEFAIAVLQLEAPAVGARAVPPAVLGSPINGHARLITYDDARRVRAGVDDKMRVSKRVITTTIYELPRRVSVKDTEVGICAGDRGGAILEIGRGALGRTRVSGLFVQRDPASPDCEKAGAGQSARLDGRVADVVNSMLPEESPR